MNQHQLLRLIRLLLRHGSRGPYRWYTIGLVVALAAYALFYPALAQRFGWSQPGASQTVSSGESAILDAFRHRQSDVAVEGSATVTRLLPDDLEGSKHQKMILTLNSGHTLLLAHNIDLAPRVPAKVGDSVHFRGEYEYSKQGGVIHWTHDDPRGKHMDGWIKLKGETYQ